MQQLLLRNMKYFIMLHLLFFFITDSWAQGFAVKGRVKGETGEGLPGVTVLLKGTSTGVTTDPGGNYTLNLPNGNGTLVIIAA